MRFRHAVASCFLALAAAAGVPAPAQEAVPPAPPTLSDAELAAMMKAVALSPQQQRLARLVGEWTCHWKLWMGPGMPPAESAGTMHAETTFGGRYVELHWSGEMMGRPYAARSTEAYDAQAKRYLSTWIEIGAGVMMRTGTCDDAMTTCTLTGPFWPLANDQQQTMRSVTTWSGDDRFETAVYATVSDGIEAKVMEIVATRQR